MRVDGVIREPEHHVEDVEGEQLVGDVARAVEGPFTELIVVAELLEVLPGALRAEAPLAEGVEHTVIDQSHHRITVVHACRPGLSVGDEPLGLVAVRGSPARPGLR